jgi:hypothetical protein
MEFILVPELRKITYEKNYSHNWENINMDGVLRIMEGLLRIKQEAAFILGRDMSHLQSKLIYYTENVSLHRRKPDPGWTQRRCQSSLCS